MLKDDFTAYVKKRAGLLDKKTIDEDSAGEDEQSEPVALLGFRRRPDFDMNVLVQMSKTPGQIEGPKKMVLYS